MERKTPLSDNNTQISTECFLMHLAAEASVALAQLTHSSLCAIHYVFTSLQFSHLTFKRP